jgi:hypothetical protein
MKFISPSRILVLALMAAILFASCDEPEEVSSNEKYKDFYNYPDGRKNATGTLEIRNTVASPVLLFTDSVSPANYIGTAESLNSIKVKLPEEKFYTIVAVDRATWEERGEQASQFSDLTYYSNLQPYSMTVSASDTFGAGEWIINNNTSYWVSFIKADQSGIIFAVTAPNAKRVTVPVKLNETFDYIPHFYKELKYQGRVIALVESDVLSAADTVFTTDANPRFHTDIGTDITPPSADIQPAVFVTNSSDKTVRVFSGTNKQLSNGASGVDFALTSGMSQLFTGLEAGTSTKSINFSSIAWTSREYVSEDTTMAINKVYRIVLNGTGGTYSTTVTEEDAEVYFK